MRRALLALVLLVVVPELGAAQTQPLTRAEYERHTAGWVNVKETRFAGGAKGDGASDDTPAFRAALAAGRRVLVPFGTYKTTGQIDVPTGAKIYADGAVLRFANTDATASVLRLNGVTDVVIEGLEIDGQKASVPTVTEAKHGIDLRKASRVTLRNLYIHHNKGDGIFVGRLNIVDGGVAGDATTDVLVENVRSDANHRQGVTVQTARRARFVHCQLTNSSGTSPQAGLDVEPDADYDAVEDVHFVGCKFSGNGTVGALIDGRTSPTAPQRFVTFTDCDFSGNTAQGAHVRDFAEVTYSSSRFDANGYAGATVGDNARDISFVGASVTSNQDRGIYINAPVTAAARIRIIGSLVKDNGQSAANTLNGIVAAGTVNGLSIVETTSTGASQARGLTTVSTVSDLRIVGGSFTGNTTAAASLADDGATRRVVGAAGLGGNESEGYLALTYASTVNIDASASRFFKLVVTDSSAFTFATPTNASAGRTITISIKAAAVPSATDPFPAGNLWKKSAWTQPANNFGRSITYYFDGTLWSETGRTTADVPN